MHAMNGHKRHDHQSDCQSGQGREGVSEISVSAITLITRSSITLKHDHTAEYVTTIQFRFTCYTIKTVSLENQPFQSRLGGACDTPHQIIGKSALKVGGAPGIGIRLSVVISFKGNPRHGDSWSKQGYLGTVFLAPVTTRFRGQVCREFLAITETIWMEFDTLADFIYCGLVGW